MADVDSAIREFMTFNEFSKPNAAILSQILLTPAVKLSLQLRALYFCRDLENADRSSILTRALDVHRDAFLRHEIAYVMGQAGCNDATDVLIALLEDVREDPMAAEAIAALGEKQCVDLMRKYENDECVVVRDTCRLALHSLLYGSSEGNMETVPICSCVSAPISTSAYRAVDPVPCSATPETENSLYALAATLHDESQELYKRYEALFKIRNKGDDIAASVIGEALLRDKVSEVFRHECAFVLGQMQCLAAVEALVKALADNDEKPIVRHEAALALGSCASTCDDDSQRLAIIKELQRYLNDPVKVVADSCLVALDVIEEALSQGKHA
ncbi:hypothetical protein BgAZ_202940 [Babesia gibsoni]|uniref:Deoxyhypusine hydroxylase n=1 Tax=Babesia gibsoni TaxID=33632 RepID=A0AAD8PDG9_BABGI|nr:hypothetical protein BgAZ_202940 [Babesia gibsoni]